MDKFDDRRSMKSSPRSCFYFSKNKSLGIRCTLDTSFKGDRQRNVRTGGGREWEGMGGEREDTGFPGAADEVLMIGSRQHQLSQLHA